MCYPGGQDFTSLACPSPPSGWACGSPCRCNKAVPLSSTRTRPSSVGTQRVRPLDVLGSQPREKGAGLTARKSSVEATHLVPVPPPGGHTWPRGGATPGRESTGRLESGIRDSTPGSSYGTTPASAADACAQDLPAQPEWALTHPPPPVGSGSAVRRKSQISGLKATF